MDAVSLQAIAGPAGLLGLIGLAGLAGIRNPCDKARAGALVRVLALLGLGGLAGLWIDGAGAMGAAGSLGLWNHQNPKLAFWGKLGWAWPVGAAFLALHTFG